MLVACAEGADNSNLTKLSPFALVAKMDAERSTF